MPNFKFDFQEFIKWFLPIALSFIGWYVSQTVAPIAAEQARQRQIIDYHSVEIGKMQIQHNSCENRISKLQDDIRSCRESVLEHQFILKDRKDP